MTVFNVLCSVMSCPLFVYGRGARHFASTPRAGVAAKSAPHLVASLAIARPAWLAHPLGGGRLPHSSAVETKARTKSPSAVDVTPKVAAVAFMSSGES